jgi:3-deoxy-D-manno-octulosonic-acid transferase
MLYDIGFAIFSIFYLPTLIFKGKLHGDFLERFGVYGKEKREALAVAKDAIWIQAVSVGEVALCRSLVPLIKERFPDRTIIFSTITKTGNDLAKKLFSNDAIVIYFPLDFSFVVRKIVGLIRPRLYVMIETEIWPNFLKTIANNKIHAVLINGRISDRSFGKYKLAKPFLRGILQNVNVLCMQSKTDAERIICLGADPAKVKVTGNMKFDIQIKASQLSNTEIRGQLGLEEGDELLVAGSTHDGEEEMITAIYDKLIKKIPQLKLLIAPRHIERADEITAGIKKHGFEPIRLSNSTPTPNTQHPTPIYILDTIGRLNDFYSVASIVFIGGSLVKHGGQNPIEPAIYGKPIIFGPYMFNFKNIAAAFVEKKAAIQVSSKKELASVIEELLMHSKKRSELGEMAKQVVIENRGATHKNLDEIGRFL